MSERMHTNESTMLEAIRKRNTIYVQEMRNGKHDINSPSMSMNKKQISITYNKIKHPLGIWKLSSQIIWLDVPKMSGIAVYKARNI